MFFPEHCSRTNLLCFRTFIFVLKQIGFIPEQSDFVLEHVVCCFRINLIIHEKRCKKLRTKSVCSMILFQNKSNFLGKTMNKLRTNLFVPKHCSRNLFLFWNTSYCSHTYWFCSRASYVLFRNKFNDLWKRMKKTRNKSVCSGTLLESKFNYWWKKLKKIYRIKSICFGTLFRTFISVKEQIWLFEIGGVLC